MGRSNWGREEGEACNKVMIGSRDYNEKGEGVVE